MVNNNEKQLADLERNLMKLETIVDEAKKQKQEAEERLKQGKTIKSLSDMELEEAKSEIRRIENEMRDYIIYKGGAVIEILDLKRRLEAKDDNLETAMASKNDEITDLTEALESEVNENNERKGEIISLNKEITKIRTELDQANLEIKKQIQQKRLGNLFAAGVFITEYLPIPEKWQTSIKTGFNTAQAWQIAADIPQATYEVIIGFTAILVFLGTKGIFYRIFGRKEINKIAELRGELQDALRQKSKFEAEIKELKETKITPEILPEEEKPAQSKNSKVKSPKKNKKKK